MTALLFFLSVPAEKKMKIFLIESACEKGGNRFIIAEKEGTDRLMPHFAEDLKSLMISDFFCCGAEKEVPPPEGTDSAGIVRGAADFNKD